MRVLILGASGFIGRHVAAHLHARGHAVVGVSRRRAEAFERHPEYGWIVGDLHRDLEPDSWRRKLYAFDAVVNCAGLHRETAGSSFETVHALGPVAVYRACARAGVRRIVHLTALGDAAARRAHWLATRRYAERKLEAMVIDWVVVAHPLVIGDDSPGCAEGHVLPGTIKELCEAIARGLEEPGLARSRLSVPRTSLPERLLLLYDGACPVCSFEMRRLDGLDRAQRLDYLDIAAPGFDAARYGTTMEALMGRMHALAPDGRLLIGMDAIRAAYSAVGLGWLLSPTRLPLLRRIADRLYLAFARNRYAISRRLRLR